MPLPYSFPLTIVRNFSASPSEVWRAWSDRNTLARWWGPRGVEVTMARHDFRPGGNWCCVMPLPDGSELVSEGIFEKINMGSQIVTSANFKPMAAGVSMDITLRETKNGTRMEFTVFHASQAQRDRLDRIGFFKGWGSAFDRLAEVEE